MGSKKTRASVTIEMSSGLIKALRQEVDRVDALIAEAIASLVEHLLRVRVAEAAAAAARTNWWRRLLFREPVAPTPVSRDRIVESVTQDPVSTAICLRCYHGIAAESPAGLIAYRDDVLQLTWAWSGFARTDATITIPIHIAQNLRL